MPEVVIADVIEGGCGSKSGDMAADIGMLVGTQNHRHGVPANIRTDAVLQCGITGRALLLSWWDGIDISGGCAIRKIGTRAASLFDQSFEQIMCPFRTFMCKHGLKRVQPFLRFRRIYIR